VIREQRDEFQKIATTRLLCSLRHPVLAFKWFANDLFNFLSERFDPHREKKIGSEGFSVEVECSCGSEDDK